MKAMCVSTRLGPNDVAELGILAAEGDPEYAELKVGRHYLVFGLEIIAGNPWIHIRRQDFDYVYPIPLRLFRVTDPRVSRYWEVSIQGASLLIAPSPFMLSSFYDKLTDGEPDALAVFKKTERLLEAEARASDADEAIY